MGQAGVGIIFKEVKGPAGSTLYVKSLAPGGPAEMSGLIQAPPPPPTADAAPGPRCRRRLFVRGTAGGGLTGEEVVGGLGQVGDALIRVDGQHVASTEAATRLILGDRGTPLTMTLRRSRDASFSPSRRRGSGRVRAPSKVLICVCVVGRREMKLRDTVATGWRP